MVLDPANGVAKREGGCLLLQLVRSNTVEEHDREALVPSCEKWTVAAADGVRCARVRWEINFLLTFETAPLICKRTVHLEDHEVEYTLCPSQ